MAKLTAHERLVQLVQIALITGIVVVFQLLGNFIPLGITSVSLVMVPVAIGAILYGPLWGAWFGFVFGAVVLLSGVASPFMAISPAGTIAIVLLKGALAGFAVGSFYLVLRDINRTFGVIVAAVIAPLVNTAVYVVGCLTIFFSELSQFGYNPENGNVLSFVITGMVGLNFPFELLLNVILIPAILRLVTFWSKKGSFFGS